MHPILLMKRIPFITIALVFVFPAAHADDNWPQFRGAEARGIGADGNGLPDTWSSTENIEWKTDLPGRGWSSPIVWGNHVFLTTAVSLEELGVAAAAPKTGLYNGRMQVKLESIFQWQVYCLDLETGAIKWNQKVHEGEPEYPTHIKNSYASETPVTDGKHVYAYFGNVGVFAFDFDGKLVWSKKIDAHLTRNGWGTAASPVLHKGRLYIVNDNHEDSYLLALDADTGDEIWRVSRDEKSNWSTPYIWENDERTEIVTPGSDLVRSYDLDGKLLWSFSGMSTITIATPYESNGLLYISSGYFQDRRARPLYAIRPGATGDISLKEDETANEFIAWSDPFGAPYNPSTIVYKDRLYVLYDRGEFGSYDAMTGEPIIERERLPRDVWNFSTSPWAYDGKIFCLNEAGKTFVLKAGDELEILHVNELTREDMGMATPALVGDRLLLRTAARLYSIRNGS